MKQIINHNKICTCIILIIKILFCFTAQGCSSLPNVDFEKINTTNLIQWFISDEQERAVAVVIHGLNVKPDKMESLIHYLMQYNITVINVYLSGHRGNIQEFKKVTRELWLTETYTAFIIAKEYADNKNIPLIFCGFSLGGLIGLDASVISDHRLYDYALLFAPAVTPRLYVQMAGIFYIFGNNFILPSKSPLHYRANTGTPIAAYKALFASVKNVKKNYNEKMNQPILCFIDKNDELVDANTLKKFIINGNLHNWKINIIQKDRESAKEKYHHLIIDQPSVGEKTWNFICMEIDLFLEKILKK